MAQLPRLRHLSRNPRGLENGTTADGHPIEIEDNYKQEDDYKQPSFLRLLWIQTWSSKLLVVVSVGALIGILVGCWFLYDDYRKESQTSPFLDASYQVFLRGMAPAISDFIFPSVEERVQYYMSDWYDYHETDHMKWLQEHACSDVPYWKPGFPVKKFPYRIDASNLRQLQYMGWPWRLPWQYHQGHHVDIATYHIRSSCPRYMIQMGDAKSNATHLDTPYPLLVKSRLSATEYDKHYQHTPNSPPILGIAHVARHYGHFQETDAVWDKIPWSSKQEQIVWRGTTSGNRRAVLAPFLSPDSEDVDFAFSYALDIHPEAKKWVKGDLSVAELLQYKYLLVLEGWGIASGLKWMLYSNSLVFMSPPTKVSWAMEEKLVPYVHYIPLKPDLSDLQSQLEWARSHDAESHQIMLQSRHYIERLVTSPIAQSETQLILEEMAQRYNRQFGSILTSCETAS